MFSCRKRSESRSGVFLTVHFILSCYEKTSSTWEVIFFLLTRQSEVNFTDNLVNGESSCISTGSV